MTNLFRELVRRARSLIKATEPVDLGLISAEVHHGCMGLPQELVDHIMDMLHDDPITLKACSLTCKAMFASARHLIHQTLRIPQCDDLCWGRSPYPSLDEEVLRSVSSKGESGLLRYTREVRIRSYCSLLPGALLPHLRHFQSLDRVHTLFFENYDGRAWANHYKTYFINFYPTLTSLTLSHPFGHYQLLLKFALQFPKLENLCIQRVRIVVTLPDLMTLATVDQSPPLRGHLRLIDADVVVPHLLDLSREHQLPNGINFRSIELAAFLGYRAQQILCACAATIENLIVAPAGLGKLDGLKLTDLKVLRRLTIRFRFYKLPLLDRDVLIGTLSTITTSTFSEFALEVTKLPSHLAGPSVNYWGSWEEVDKFLQERFAERGDFKFIIGAGGLYDREIFQRHAQESFPLSANRGCIHFERSHLTRE